MSTSFGTPEQPDQPPRRRRRRGAFRVPASSSGATSVGPGTAGWGNATSEQSRVVEPVPVIKRDTATDRVVGPEAPRVVEREIPADRVVTQERPINQGQVLAREKARFGGIKVGSAFFGWLTATGMAVLLTAVASAAGSAVALSTANTVNQAATVATNNATTIGIVSGIVLLVILLVSYFCGGYVAGRMARLDGARQGVAVWLWALVIAAAVAVAAAVAGSKYNVLSHLNSYPRIPVHEGHLGSGSIIAAVAVAVIALIGAVLGGRAGMRFHRKVDRAGLAI